MGKGGGGSSTPQYIQSPPTSTTTVANSTPWSGQEPYLKDIFAAAKTDYASPFSFYGGQVSGVPTGQTYAPLSPDTQLAMAMTEGTALGDTVTPAATNFATGMLSGDFLGAGNPYFSNMVRQIGSTVTPQVESQFEKAGRYGSGAMDKSLASAMTDTAGNLAYQNYANILGEMGKANYVAPQTAQAQYAPSQAIAGVGAKLEDQTQNAINQAMQEWQFSQMEPWQRLGLFSNMIQGNYGGQTVSNTAGSSSGQWYQPQSSGSNIGSLISGIGGLGLLGYSMFSDKRTKENVEPLKTVLAIIKQFNPVTFDYKPEFGEPGQVGFVADEVEKIAPGMVFTDEIGLKHITPFAIIPLLVKAIQEQQKQIEELRGSV